MKKVVVTGVCGQLGSDVLKALAAQGTQAVGLTRVELDLTKPAAEIEEKIVAEQPDVIIHCAAYTKVDMAEEEREQCYAVNVTATEAIARAAARCKASMLYVSTDYVFSGEGERPWKPEDAPDPVNYYGYTKYMGEEAVKKHLTRYYIVRICWTFGANGSNFVKTMLRLSGSRDTVTVVNDQIGSPTYTVDLAELFVQLIRSECFGIYHAANEGYCSWYEFAKEIFLAAGKQMTVLPTDSASWNAKAVRPKNSRMDTSGLQKIGIAALPSWKDALGRYLNSCE